MAITLRPHQVTACQDIDRLFNNGALNICCVLPTGAGKSLTLAHYAHRALMKNEVTVVFAHRDVLISQLSEALCKTGVPHSFICSDKARRDITNNNRELFGDSFYDETSPIVVSSTPTFNARLKNNKIPERFLLSVKWWLQDETHHLVQNTSWFNCIEPMRHSKGIGFTATPIRGDKKGLGRHSDGVFDELSVTTNMFTLIKDGMLTPYKIYTTGMFDVKNCNVTSNGDYNQKKLAIGVNKRDIIGDAVGHYQKLINGAPAITFCVNIEHAKAVADQFNEAGIRSIAISSKSDLKERQQAMEDFRAGRIINLVNVDLLGEGYDCPAVTAVIMLRPTQSYSLFKQQFGRMLRNSDGKAAGILLDHVGNTQYFMEKYGLSAPHDDPEWTLDRVDNRKKPKDDDDDDDERAETITCGECSAFGLVKKSTDEITDDEIGLIFIDGRCPECGHCETDEEKEDRKREIKTKQGELVALEFDVIESLISQRNASLRSVSAFGHSLGNAPFKAAAMDKFARKQHALSILRHWIQEWCTKHGQLTGQSVSLVQLDFEIKFGINIFKAQALTDSKMSELSSRIQYQTGVMK